MNGRFEGFPQRGLRFLRGLERHNDREWFNARKEIYEQDLLAPMRALVNELSEHFSRQGLPLYGDERRSIFRIYRDVRFTHDKRPYKTHMSAYLSPDGGRHTPGGLYVHVSPKESFISAAFYDLEKPLLHRWRREMAEKPAAFSRVLQALRRSRLGLIPPDEEEDSLARLPRGFAHLTGSPLAPYFRLRHFLVHHDLESETLASRRLVTHTLRFVDRVVPLLMYGWQLAGAPRTPDRS
ncbi:MAG: DUF2461 domain-containing protein [Candidatus Eremiobacteraeota bacterium]|nr:DUF2461 domain-containing protein [Candidatus Eremiobacteraeota bacterium]MBV8355897.1 DUF2461 domain-containing protein [Candidatus Eremiobacteraeota bacterium]